MARGRRCCCCQDWYIGNGPSYLRYEGGKGIYRDGASAIPTLNTLATLQFDFVNKQVYIPYNPASGATNGILRADKELVSSVKVCDVSGAGFKIRNWLAIHPWNGHIFYGGSVAPFTSISVKRCNYDGTNHITLTTLAGGIVRGLAVSKEEEFVFYSTDGDKLRRCNADGTDDQQIYDGTAASRNTLNRICIDNKTKKVFVSAGNQYVVSMLFDGTGAATIFDAAASRPPLPPTGQVLLGNYSHKNERLYIWAANVNTATQPSGMYSMKADGSDIRAEVIYPNITFNGNPLNADQLPTGIMCLGCGYEKTGPSTLGS